MNNMNAMLLALGTDSPVPEFLIDCLSQEAARMGLNVRDGMLDAFVPIPGDHMALVTAPHGDPAQRDRVQEMTANTPAIIIGFSEERPFYPDACVWIDIDHLTPQVLRHGLIELKACLTGQLRPLLIRQKWILECRRTLERKKDLHLQLISCRWRPAASGDSAEIRLDTQQSFEYQLRACAPSDALIGKLLDDQFVVISEDRHHLSGKWLQSHEADNSLLWTSFLSAPFPLRSYDHLGEALQHCVREVERSRMMDSRIGARALTSKESLIVKELVRALRNREFYLEFQPQFDIHTGCMVGAEALLRWLHPELGLVPPTAFIRDAEMAGVIRTLGHWALRETLTTWKRLNDKDISIRMAVNVSFPEVADPDYAEKVLDLLEEVGVPATNLELELTETAMMLDASISLQNLNRLKLAGVHIVLDDFGTGFSSLSHLNDLPITGIKLDRAFVTPLSDENEDSAQRHIVATMIDLSKRLNLETTAEGIEDQACLEVIHALGCDRIQGYIYAEPMPINQLIERARSQNAIPATCVSGQQNLF